MKNTPHSNRMLFTIKKSLQHKKCLQYFLTPQGRCPDVTTLTPKQIEAMGIQVLVLDFDGVLSPYAAAEPSPQVQIWLHDLLKAWSGQVFILSNKPFAEREAFMKKEFPSIHFVSGVAQKPFPQGLEKIISLSKALPQEILMIDDRLLTGILAACIARTKGLLVIHPLRQLKGKKALHELFFSILRWMDAVWVRLI